MGRAVGVVAVDVAVSVVVGGVFAVFAGGLAGGRIGAVGVVAVGVAVSVVIGAIVTVLCDHVTLGALAILVGADVHRGAHGARVAVQVHIGRTGGRAGVAGRAGGQQVVVVVGHVFKHVRGNGEHTVGVLAGAGLPGSQADPVVVLAEVVGDHIVVAHEPGEAVRGDVDGAPAGV